jgi:hypothetical protein
MQTAEKATETTTAVTGTRDGYIPAESLNALKRIGSTVYELEVYVKSNAGETIEEKIMRLIRNDLNLTSSHVKINMPQTSRLAERSLA